MLSILIADDEKLARADIVYKVSRSGFYFKWVREAASAEAALEMIKEYKPDILITDIKMGTMSGIDLVCKAREYKSDLVSIFFSGYSKFSYAQKAISLGVSAYLLKPVRQGELTDVLTEIIAKVMYQRNPNTLHLNRIDATVDAHLLNQHQKEQLHAFLCGIESKLDFDLGNLFSEKAKYYQIGLIRLRADRKMDKKNYNDNSLEKICNQLSEEIKETLAKDADWFLLFSNFAQKRLITVIAASPEQDKALAGKRLAEVFRKVQHAVYVQKNMILDIGVSDVGTIISSIMMTQAHQSLDLRFSLESSATGNVFFWNEREKQQTGEMLENDFKLYERLLVSGDLDNAVDAVKRIFSSDSMNTALHLRMLYVEVVCILARISAKKKGSIVISMLGAEYLGGSVIDQFDSREEMLESLCRITETVLSQWMDTDAEGILHNVKNYIEDNFTNSELSTNYLSSRFCISLGYLSTSYKKAFGITISQYIIWLRIDYAKKLLADTELSASQIAANSGFNNFSYFMRTFKKHVNCTPIAYREDSH